MERRIRTHRGTTCVKFLVDMQNTGAQSLQSRLQVYGFEALSRHVAFLVRRRECGSQEEAIGSSSKTSPTNAASMTITRDVQAEVLDRQN